jgi:hypothetical protein
MKLFIDDERFAPEGYDALARTNEMAIALMESADHLELVSMDYDAHSHLPWTFIHAYEWMAENNVWPDEIRIHTRNHWDGRPWIEKLLKKNAPKTTKVDYTDPWAGELALHNPNVNETRPDWVQEFFDAQKRV